MSGMRATVYQSELKIRISLLLSSPGDSKYPKEARINVMHALSSTQTPNFSKQLDSDLVANLQSVTFNRVNDATDRDPKLFHFREAQLTTYYRNTLQDGLEKFNRYRDRLSVLDKKVMYDFKVALPGECNVRQPSQAA